MNIWILALFVISCVYATHAEETKPKKHEKDLSSKDHFVGGEHHSEYDNDAFLGKMKDEFEDLPPEEAKKRLKILIKKVDTDNDGFVTEEELTKWVRDVFRQRLMEGSDEDFNDRDKDNNGKISWEEYMQSAYGPEELEEGDDEIKELVKRDKRRFDTADKDKDGAVKKDEYLHFMHPESSEEMGDVHVLETIEDVDRDNDGYVSLNEFLGDYRDPEDEEEEPEWVKEETNKFHKQYDKNQDGKLDKEEVLHWILPETDHAMAQEESRHLISIADENKDGKLSEDEITNNHETFIGSEATDYGRALPKHEEL